MANNVGTAAMAALNLFCNHREENTIPLSLEPLPFFVINKLEKLSEPLSQKTVRSIDIKEMRCEAVRFGLSPGRLLSLS